MNILITGGAGFIGSHLVDACMDAGHTVSVLDNFSTGSRDNLTRHKNNTRLTVCEGDICDQERVDFIMRSFSPAVVFHLAAQINVRESIKDPAHDIEVNILGTVNILSAMEKTDCRRIIFSSTGGAMYGGNTPPYSESQEAKPETPYGISKRTVELLLDFYARQHGYEVTMLRYANVYGPRQNALGEAGVISIFLEKIRKNERPRIYGDGHQTRDFIHVDDIVSANMHVLTKNLTGIYHVGTGIETSVNTLWSLLAGKADITLVPEYVPSLGEIQRSALDSRKLQETGWIISKTLSDLTL